MNPVPIVVAGVVVAAVPQVRRRVVPVSSAIAGGALGVAGATVSGVGSVAGAVIGGAGGVLSAAIGGSGETPPEPSR